MSEAAQNTPELPESNATGATATLPSPRMKPRVKQPRLWNVVLLDDEDHSYEYVIEAMQKVFSHSVEQSFTIAERVDKDGRAVCGTFHKELAELKLEQLHAQGRDFRIASCKGAMSAIIEPADCGENE